VRGRATSVALPALVVLVLVGVVAVAATGSIPDGSNSSRTPSASLLDMLFTLWIVAVVAGGILLVYGLLQRQASARQVASRRYPRVSVLAWVAFWSFLALLVWAFTRYRPRGFNPVEEEPPFGIPGQPPPPVPDDKTLTPYEPSVSWVPIVVVVALVVVAALAFVVSTRRSRVTRDPRAELARDLAGALDDALDDLHAEPDPRRAIIAAYARLERVLASNGVARLGSETADEYLVRVLHELELPPGAIGRLTELFAQAKFSHHDVDSTMKESAIDALEQVRDELQALAERAEAPRPDASRAATT
jgi:Domain of unknown function (DUF4129)